MNFLAKNAPIPRNPAKSPPNSLQKKITDELLHLPCGKQQIKFEFLARKGSLEAFFSLCSQYFLRK